MESYRGKYNPKEVRSYKMSRSQIESFINCKRCFYLDRKLGVKRPPQFPFNLNNAVDSLLKNEFDHYREKQQTPPLLEQNGIDAIPYAHPYINTWRANFQGIEYIDKKTNLLIHGAIDDVWINPEGELIIVDYKATSKKGEVSLDAEWQDGYKRQMQIYQWLMTKNGFKVSPKGYFVYCNGISDLPSFNAELKFKISVISYTTEDNSWIEKAINDIYELLNNDQIPKPTKDCPLCAYNKSISTIENTKRQQNLF